MESIMMQLGPFQFGLSTAAYQELARSTAYRWPAQDRFGEMAALQFTGPGDDTISLSGTIYPEFRAGIFQLDDLRELAAGGKPLMLVNGLGIIMGSWVVESIEEKGSVFADAGVARRQDFSLKLKRYGDMGEDDLAEAQKTAAAIQEQNTRPESGLVLSGTATGPLAGLGSAGSALAGLAADVSSVASGATASLQAGLAAIQGVAGGITGGIAQISGAINGALGAAQSLKSTGLSLGGIASLAGAPAVLSDVMGKAATLNSAAMKVAGLVGAAGKVPGLVGGVAKTLASVQASAGKITTTAGSIYSKGQAVVGLLKL